jgi:hypothetical protein
VKGSLPVLRGDGGRKIVGLVVTVNLELNISPATVESDQWTPKIFTYYIDAWHCSKLCAMAL